MKKLIVLAFLIVTAINSNAHEVDQQTLAKYEFGYKAEGVVYSVKTFYHSNGLIKVAVHPIAEESFEDPIPAPLFVEEFFLDSSIRNYLLESIENLSNAEINTAPSQTYCFSPPRLQDKTNHLFVSGSYNKETQSFAKMLKLVKTPINCYGGPQTQPLEPEMHYIASDLQDVLKEFVLAKVEQSLDILDEMTN